MLYSLMFLLESQQGDGKAVDSDDRQSCASAMAAAARAMGECRNVLWSRGVPDETVVLVPCRIAYKLLERATGVVARKAACGDLALEILQVTVDSAAASVGTSSLSSSSSEHGGKSSVLTTITAALMDMMHSYEHMAPLVAELCAEVSERPVNRLAIELLREIGRLDCGGSSGGDGGSTISSKASGIRNVAPFVPHLAALRPRLVLQQLSHVLPHLQSESYYLRSAIVNASTQILVEYIGNESEPLVNSGAGAVSSPVSTTSSNDGEDEEEEERNRRPMPLDTSKSREALLDVLTERVYDVSSFTRAAALKAWISLTDAGKLPKDRLLSVTKIAIDRLQDKTVVVRKQAMHVRLLLFAFTALPSFHQFCVLTHLDSLL